MKVCYSSTQTRPRICTAEAVLLCFLACPPFVFSVRHEGLRAGGCQNGSDRIVRASGRGTVADTLGAVERRRGPSPAVFRKGLDQCFQMLPDPARSSPKPDESAGCIESFRQLSKMERRDNPFHAPRASSRTLALGLKSGGNCCFILSCSECRTSRTAQTRMPDCMSHATVYAWRLVSHLSIYLYLSIYIYI